MVDFFVLVMPKSIRISPGHILPKDVLEHDEISKVHTAATIEDRKGKGNRPTK